MFFNVLVKSLGAEICSTKYSMRTSIPRGPAGWQIQIISEYDYYALYCKIVMVFPDQDVLFFVFLGDVDEPPIGERQASVDVQPYHFSLGGIS